MRKIIIAATGQEVKLPHNWQEPTPEEIAEYGDRGVPSVPVRRYGNHEEAGQHLPVADASRRETDELVQLRSPPRTFARTRCA
jgi:hypothetical protein